MRAHAHARTRKPTQLELDDFLSNDKSKKKTRQFEKQKNIFLKSLKNSFSPFYFEKSFETVFRKVILIEKQKRLQIVFEKI